MIVLFSGLVKIPGQTRQEVKETCSFVHSALHCSRRQLHLFNLKRNTTIRKIQELNTVDSKRIFWTTEYIKNQISIDFPLFSYECTAIILHIRLTIFLLNCYKIDLRILFSFKKQKCFNFRAVRYAKLCLLEARHQGTIMKERLKLSIFFA